MTKIQVSESQHPYPRRPTNSIARKISNFARAYPLAVPYCAPYWDGATLWAIFSRIVSGRVCRGADITRLEQRLSELFAADILTCTSGRFALELALRRLGLPAGAQVIIPSFCCRSIVLPILAVGAQPRFADVGSDLNLTAETVRVKLTSETRAVVVPHLFGNPAPIDEIVDICKSRNILVIDDAAQALGAEKDGQRLGTFGDVGIISFGNGKVCFGTGGGAVISTRGQCAPDTGSILPQCPVAESIRKALRILAFRRWKKWLYPLQRIKWKSGGRLSQLDDYRRSSIANLDAAVAVSLLDTLEQNLSARRERVRGYRSLLANAEKVRLIDHAEGSACLTQPIEITGEGTKERIVRITTGLRRNGYEINRSYTPLHLTPEFAQFGACGLPYTDHVWERVIELPCEPTVSRAHMGHIAHELQHSV